ncbi:MAG: alpha/beta hydrolase [Planctomycetota bacterium]
MRDEVIDLWPDMAGGPGLKLYPTTDTKPRGGVMVCPGGGYGSHAPHEGEPVAERLNAAGFDAAVLTYRVAPHRHPAMLHDARRGLRLMRQHPAIRSPKIAVLGFSAGGHLASTLTVHHGRFPSDIDEFAATVNGRPDAAILCYPVIDLVDNAIAHAGSRLNLLGPEPDADLLELLTTHRHVAADTPPTFLWHTAQDASVVCDNSLRFAEACRVAGVPVEMHIYEEGSHGIGLAEDHPEARGWFDACAGFLDRHLNAAPVSAGR